MKKWWLLLIISLVVACVLYAGDFGADRRGKFNGFLEDTRNGFERRHKYLSLQDPQ